MLGERSLDELKCLKGELKAWESMFERKHARKPNKDDVNNASEEIRDTYLKYNQLKRGSKDVKKIDTQKKDEEENEVFGRWLDKSKTPVSANKSVRIQISPTEYKPIKLCHGQRQKKPLTSKLKTNFMESSGRDVEKMENKNQSSCMATVNDSGISDDLGFSILSARKDALNKPGMMLGKSTLTKRMKRRSALASDWLEKNQSELAENSLNGIDPVLNESNDSRRDFNDEFDNANHEGSKTDELTKSSWLNTEKISTRNVCLETDRQTELHGEDTVDHKSVKNCNPKESKTTGSVSKKQASESNQYNSSNLFITDNTDNNNGDLFSTTRNTINSQSMESNYATKSSSDNSSDLLVARRSTGNQNAENNSTTKRKRTKVVKASNSTSEHIESSFGDDVEGKPTKKRKTSDDVYREMNMEQVENGEMEGKGGTGQESENERSQSEKRSQGNGVKKRSSGLVSENFHALNMKVRRYSQRGHGTNYAAYKRKMWKQKQQANEQADSKKDHWKKRKGNSSSGNRRISSTTTTTCFKCGEDGHWVKDCPRNKPVRAQLPAENWSEPVEAPADLEIADEQWQATEEKLQSLISDRLPRAQNIPAQAPPAIEPLYQPVNDQPINTPQEVYDALNKLGFDSFRCGQEESIMQILCGLSTLVVLSTGAGKSLCYQLPAYMYSRRSPCMTLVISPLVSLMEDQVVGLPFGLHGVSLNTNMTKQQRQKAVDQICSGKATVVLVSPEALVGGSSGAGCLPHPSKLPPIAFACIDEAHCVSEWSHNFRPSYLRVCKVLRERFGVRCFLGLTATATRSTALSVCEHLGIIHRPEAIVRGATIPDNLNLSVSCDLNRDRAILELLQGSRFSDCDSIIIYCTRREQTERLATYLRTCLQKNPMNTSSSITDQNEADDMEKENKGKKRGRKRKSETAKSKSGKKSTSWQAECYHAGLSAAQRKKVQKRFMAGELRIVVATVAFGMGLDKADVRAVIHYNMPKSFESYVQEIGRAGRDGLPSHCHVFIDPEGKDVRELRRHAYASTVDRNTIKKLVHQIFPTCDCKTLHANVKQKRDKELGLMSTGSNAESANQDWFVGDDDVIEHVIELESKITPKTDVDKSMDGTQSNDKAIVDQIPRDDDIRKNDLTNSGDVTASCDITTCDDVMGVDDLTNSNDVTRSCDVMNIDGIMGIDGVTNNDDVTGNDEVLGHHHTEDGGAGSNRVCGGHEVAIPTEKAVQQLDMKEEAIETLLCYLELHAKRWTQILKSIRSTCTLKFYGGPAHLHYVAQRVPMVTAAVAYARKHGKFQRNTSCLTFPIVKIVDEMGWDLEPVRRELYGLQWNEGLRLAGEAGLSAGHSGIIVEFTDLAFHVRAPGDLSGDEKDEVCDFLEDRIMAQERSQLGQLHKVWSTFNTRAHPNCWQSAEECDKKIDGDLKSIIKTYFESENDATKSELEALSTARKNSEFLQSVIPAEDSVNWDAVSRDIRSFITSHGDLELSGRAIARVFHGIDSPCFPASVWGRERRYWRRHLDVDFNLLRKCATKELVKFR